MHADSDRIDLEVWFGDPSSSGVDGGALGREGSSLEVDGLTRVGVHLPKSVREVLDVREGRAGASFRRHDSGCDEIEGVSGW